jgi:hypothetical protein
MRFLCQTDWAPGVSAVLVLQRGRRSAVLSKIAEMSERTRAEYGVSSLSCAMPWIELGVML